ncbi:uncharacterized protein N7479_000486 [Penicillium vulpinum]|uniref:Uncharacterized protein n=1 Tax=Penicillium vulpinum TaxID=29845 RepID=A0A1V6S5U3_9EURO|nr:uncharacterized protein N7479_000486 [Penicillium vulpinum]KAJ5970568.1 hypothetical protein N7479_000486 [Penicillium vulpinum]OQE09099.1 hypothetical protein PENVUL_c007G02387 [Penicillium vulpinum]
MSNTPEGSPPAPARRWSPSRPPPTTFEFEFDQRNESDIEKIVPKLKGESNWVNWEDHFYMALKENNKAYIRVIREDNTRPVRPDYLDTSESTVRRLLAVNAGGNEELVTDVVVRETAKERQNQNYRLRSNWQKEVDKWDQCNTRVCNLMFSTVEPVPASLIDKVENAITHD